MNLLYVYFSDYDPSMAHGGQIIHTANALQVHHDVTVTTAGDIESFAKENGIDLQFNIKKSPLYVNNSYVDHLVYYLYTTAFFRSADIVFTRDIWFLKFLRYLPDRITPPVIYEAHQCYAGIDYISPKEEYDRLKQADIIITQSHGVADDLQSLGLEVANVIPNAANTELIPDSSANEIRSQLGIKENSTVIVYSGSLNEWKNDIELLIDGVRELREQCTLLIIGGDDDRVRELEKRAKKSLPTPIEARFTGRIPHRDVFKYLKASDIGVVPLRKGHEEAERYTSPIKLFEYLASGLQIVASDVPAIDREFGENEVVHLFEPGETESLVDAFEHAMSVNTTPQNIYSYEQRAKLINEYIEQF